MLPCTPGDTVSGAGRLTLPAAASLVLFPTRALLLVGGCLRPLCQGREELVGACRRRNGSGQRCLERHHVAVEITRAVFVLGDDGSCQLQSGKYTARAR